MTIFKHLVKFRDPALLKNWLFNLHRRKTNICLKHNTKICYELRYPPTSGFNSCFFNQLSNFKSVNCSLSSLNMVISQYTMNDCRNFETQSYRWHKRCKFRPKMGVADTISMFDSSVRPEFSCQDKYLGMVGGGVELIIRINWVL